MAPPKTARQIQESFEAFTAHFLAPLFTGGSVRVAQPIGPGVVATYALSRPADPDVDRALYDGLHRGASEIAPVARVPYPDGGVFAIGVACHNLLAVTDPALAKWPARSARAVVIDWVHEVLETAGDPRTRGDALARHAIVSRVMALQRRDVVVKNWAYTYRFFGRPVPKRVVALPRIRFVRQTHEDRSVMRLWSELAEAGMDRTRFAGAFNALGARSPVSVLLMPEMASVGLDSPAVTAVLSDDAIRGGVARAVVASGLRQAEGLGRALRQISRPSTPPAVLYFALALLYETHVTALLDARSSKDQVLTTLSSPEEAWFACVLPAVFEAPGALASFVELDADDRARVEAQAGRLRRAIAPEIRAAVAALVLRAAPPSSEQRIAPPVESRA